MWPSLLLYFLSRLYGGERREAGFEPAMWFLSRLYGGERVG
ncbi:hypothetical protein D1BOALGB6SA_9712 [Olavius sp. associated proteobacterium Delta 1]|nr:hypothetical protein D1BOALGB6SA_9712 [Olavius sp. associated proteobacterium Delta 1]